MKISKKTFQISLVCFITFLLGAVAFFIMQSTAQNKTNSSLIGSTEIGMEVGPSSYYPSKFTVPAGKQVKWDVINAGASGCTNFLVAKGLLKEMVTLKPKGETTKVSFIAPEPGKYIFSCSMGMVTGEIIAI